jgi:cobalt-zinc-cadmium efflux system protein
LFSLLIAGFCCILIGGIETSRVYVHGLIERGLLHMGTAHEHSGIGRTRNKQRLLLTLGLAAVYMIAEIVGGLLTNSLALLADAGHMFSDVAALALSLIALRIAERPPTRQRTYGHYRAEILAALSNGAMLVVIAIFIFLEAYKRLPQPPEVQGAPMMGIAVGGLAINLLGLWILHPAKSESLNVRGAWLHVMSDALGSLGAILAGGLIWTLHWYWVDTVISILIGALVIHSAWALLQESVSILMEGTPRGIDVDEVRDAMIGVSGVMAVHDLHMWTITTGLDALSAHVIVANGRPYQKLLKEMHDILHDRFGIDHTTIQIEPEDFEERQLTCWDT